MLESAELGYANDQRRLFIGNEDINIGRGNGLITDFIIPHSLISPDVISIFVGDHERSDYRVSGNTLIFSDPPGEKDIIMKFNSEIIIKDNASSNIIQPNEISLTPNAKNEHTGIILNLNLYDAAIINYTLSNGNGSRIGQIFIIVNEKMKSSIKDVNTTAGKIGIIFKVSVKKNILKLMYDDNDNMSSKFKYTYQLWQSK